MTAAPARRSLVSRAGLALAVGLGLALAVLFLFFQPYLGDAFHRESARLLQQEQARARDESRREHDGTEAVLSAGVEHAWDAARAEVADAPIELSADDPAALRELLGQRLDEAAGGTERKLAALAAEIRARSEARQRDADRTSQALNAQSAREFGRELALRVALMLLALLTIVFVLLGLLLYRGVIAPVQRLSAATRAVADGRMDTRIPTGADDEIGRLAASFNAMTESLERALGDLRDLNTTLEEKVRAKTAELSDALAESREANRRLETALGELRAKERELRHADKMTSLGVLAGGIAHEFNNFLGGILGCAEDASHETDPDEVRATLGVIQRTARRGAAITEKLLRFARPSEGERVRLDLADVARDVAALIEPEAARSDVTVAVETGGDTRAMAEEAGMHQVLLNLATNAVHAMQEGHGGRLTLSVMGLQSGAVRVSVTDTGVGITPEARERLFEPFFTTRGVSGTGLGLAVSYGIVQAHGGLLSVESEPGRGATFHFDVPAGPPAAEEGEKT